MATKYAQVSGDWSGNIWYDAESGGNLVTPPGATDDAVINAGIEVSLDAETSDISVNSCDIKGVLKYTNSASSSLIFDAGTSLIISGSLLVGTEATPIGATLSLEIKADSWTIDSGAEVKLYGSTKTCWTRLDGAVSSGASSITVWDATEWKVGDAIVLCTTNARGESEEFTISSISGNTIGLSSTTSYDHADGGYVLNISRNVKLSGDAGDLTNFREGNVLSNVEIYNFGTIEHSSGTSTSFLVDGCSFNFITKPLNPDYAYNLTVSNTILYKCDYIESITSDSTSYSCSFNNIFMCMRKSETLYTYCNLKQPSNSFYQNLYICDIKADVVLSVSTYGFVKGLNIWAVSTPWNKSIISSRGIYINGFNLYEWGSDSSSRIFDGDVLVANNATIGSGYTAPKAEWSLSNSGYKAVCLGYSSGWCNYYKYGEVCSSVFLSIAGRGGSGEALVFSPSDSSKWLYYGAETNALLYLFQNPSFPVNSGKTITLSFWVKVSTSGFDGDLQIAAEGCGINYSWTSVDLTGADSDWVQRSFTLGTTTDKGFVRLKIRAKDGATVSGDIYLDDFAITES